MHVLREALLASGMVGTPDAPDTCPLILDADGRVYLHRYFDYERRLARRLLAPSSAHARASSAARREALLDGLFAANAKRLGRSPRLAEDRDRPGAPAAA